jgi:hypothetical protein
MTPALHCISFRSPPINFFSSLRPLPPSSLSLGSQQEEQNTYQAYQISVSFSLFSFPSDTCLPLFACSRNCSTSKRLSDHSETLSRDKTHSGKRSVLTLLLSSNGSSFFPFSPPLRRNNTIVSFLSKRSSLRSQLLHSPNQQA